MSPHESITASTPSRKLPVPKIHYFCPSFTFSLRILNDSSFSAPLRIPPPFFYIHSQAISLFLKVGTKFHPISDSDITLPSNLKHVCPKAKLSSIITLTHPPPRDAASFSPLHRPQTIHLYTSQPWTINTILNAKLVTKCNRLPHNISSNHSFYSIPSTNASLNGL